MKPAIVLVEDDRWLAESYMRTLQSEFTVHSVSRAEEAIDIIDEEMPAAVVLDVVLDGGNGFALAHELQSHDDLSSIPVILLTTLATELQQQELRQYGVVSVLDKTTVKPPQLINEIKAII